MDFKEARRAESDLFQITAHQEAVTEPGQAS